MRARHLAVAALFLIATASLARSQGLTPAQVRQAYGLTGLSADGSGQTIAIIGAYHYADALSALNTFSSNYSLPTFNTTGGPTFTVLDENGGTSLPTGTDSGWAEEAALDIQWAHAMAPKANIVLYEASGASSTSLYNAVNAARNNAAVSVVSMSFGSAEYSGQSYSNSTFTTPSSRYNATVRQGVTFIASTGDKGPPPSYPATSGNVVAVGGTRLTVDGSGNYVSESAWSSAGGGPSVYESQPAYQASYAAANGGLLATQTMRATPDVSFVGDPATGVSIYYNGSWLTVGGTSVGAPCWAGMIAVADQIRTDNGYGTLDGPTETLPGLYGLPSTDFRDITTGSITNGTTTYAAGLGYDFATGLGTPIANLLLPALAAYGVGTSGVWIGAGGGSWAVQGNWSNGSTPGATNQDTATFGDSIGSSAVTITLDGSRMLSSLTFGTTAGGSYTLARAAGDTTSVLTLATTGAAATLTNNGGNHAINVPIVLQADVNVTAASGSMLTLSGPVSETGGGRSLTLNGGGTLVLAAANSFSGSTTVVGGTLQLAHTQALQNSTLNLAAGGAVAFASGNVSPAVGGLSGAGNITLATAAAEPVVLGVGGNGQSTTYGGSLSGTGGLTKQGSGTLTVTGTHTYAGPTVVSAGTLKLQPPNPMSVTANLGLWLDASKLSLSNGASVAAWSDLSGNNRNASGGTSPTFNAANAAFNNLPTVHFDGSSQYLNVDLSFLANSSYTIFAVTAKNSATAPAYFLGDSTGSHGPNNTILQCGWAGDTTVRLGQYGNDLSTTGPAYTGSEVASLYQGKLDSSGSAGAAGHYVYYNDATVATSNSNTNTTPLTSSNSGTVGKVQYRPSGSGTKYNWFNGDIAEILVYNAALSDADRLAVDAYLNAKWNLGLSGLPAMAATNLLPVATPLSIASGATLDLGGVNQQAASLSDAGVGGGRIINSAGTASVLTLSPQSGSAAFSGTIGGGGAISLVKCGSGAQVLTGANTYAGLTTVTAGTLELGPLAQDPVLKKVGASYVGAGADIQGGKIVFDYATGASPAAAIGEILTASYAGGWNGQIKSTTADSTHGLGWIDDGAGQVKVAYTFYGDADLNGTVNSADLAKVLANYNLSGMTWAQGDFDYNGTVNSADLAKVLANYNLSLPAPGISGSFAALDAAAIQMLASQGIEAVPEPGSLALLAAGAVILPILRPLARRRYAAGRTSE